MSIKLSYAMMTQNRLVETIRCLESVLPFVDQAIVVDGGSNDDSIFYLRNWAEKEPKLKFFLHPWTDDFSAQRNNYLKHVPDHTWVLVSDPDEWFSDEILQNLPKLIDTAEFHLKDMIGFNCRSQSFKGPVKVWDNLDNYWKRLLFKKYPGTKYAGNPHEHLINHPQRMMDTQLEYYHVKQENIIWHRGFRNFVAGGGGPNLGARNPRWVEFRKLTTELGLNSWHEIDKYLIRGNIDQRLKDMLFTFKDLTGFDGASEHREGYKLYFRIYHPEEEPLEFQGLHIE